MTTTATTSVVFIGDTPRILVNCATDVTAATVRKILYRKPDGVYAYWDATQDDNDEKIYYDAVITDFDMRGKWQFQSYIELPDWKGHGRIAELQVHARLSD
ncbi:MAG: hypothetical protein ACYSYL_00195 [Planctomycetota bacterium]|jgi:hypothetical protein